MISGRTILSSIALLVVVGFGSQAWSEELTEAYLEGRWALDGSSCNDAGSAFVTFRDTGAVEEVRDGRLEAAGFWELSDEVVTVNVVASPAFFHDDSEESTAVLQDFDGEYFGFRIRVIPFDVEADRFSAVGILDDEISKTTFNRCKA